ncbi:LysE family translocator [Acerihabitans sp. TG2]|uniref:LysE family translocator n=1 Tax=Acerihabitans sp. TG2 TaxID=3096008 RepID=UPI002B22F1C4|nr:LysE family translocator [Acerihabitans sp. TG2]MEA9390128.1 LysE family translocator [Acerihabitans sp. TG2]
MQAYLSLITITGALAAGAVSPGPSFIFVARNAMSLSRRHGFATALGMGSGAFIFSIFALLGLQAVFSAVPVAFWLLKIVGGVYLILLASNILRSARQPLHGLTSNQTASISLWQAYIFGLFTQLSNPKTAIVFAGVFSALLPQQIPPYFYAVIPLATFCVDAGWYSMVALVLSSEKPRNAYLRVKTLVDCTAGGVMGLLGLKLILSSK